MATSRPRTRRQLPGRPAPRADATVARTPRRIGIILYRGKYRFRVLYGGRGSAKSWQIARALILIAHGSAIPLRILCAREFQSSIKDSVHQLLKTQIRKLGLLPWFKIQDTSIMSRRNGSEFLFKGLRQNVDEVKSTEGIDYAWIEEAQRMSQRSWDVLIPTVRKPGSEIWVSFNPDLPTDPTFKMFVTESRPDALVAKVTWRDNPWLPDVLRAELALKKETDYEAYLHIWEGETWTRSKEQILDGKWELGEFEISEDHEKRSAAGWYGPYWGLDYGFSTSPLVVEKVWVHKPTMVLYVEDERYDLLVENDQIRPMVQEMGGLKARLRADAARPETTSWLRKNERLDVISAKKWPGSIEDGITHLRSYKRIVIHPRCKLAHDQAKLWRYKVDKLTGEVTRDVIDAHNDSWDAIRYALDLLIRQRVGPSVLFATDQEESQTAE